MLRNILIFLSTLLFTVAVKDVTVSRSDVYFRYYSSQYTVISVPENDVAKINIATNSQIYIFIHSYWDYWNDPHYYRMKNHLWSNGISTNIFMIDYGELAAALEYRKTVEVARGIGNIVCNWILALAESKGISLSVFNLVGAHLGAHVAGFVGKCVYLHTQARIGFIFALDPCGAPYYSINTPANDRLDILDANVVVAFRSDILFYGYSGDLGHFDIYVNQGHSHSFCTPGLCGHKIVLEVFVYCLAEFDSFTAIRCDNYEDYDNKHSSCHKESSRRAILVCGGGIRQRDAGRYYITYLPKM